MNHRSIITLVVLLSTCLTASAAPTVVADVEPIFPGGRGGGTAAVGNAEMNVVNMGDKSVIRLASTRGPAAGAWWFPNHARLKPEQALVGVQGAGIAMLVKSRVATNTDVTLQWRGTGDKVRQQAVELPSDQLTRVQFAVPDPKSADPLGGLMISFAKAGEYEIHSIAVTREGKTLLEPIPPIDPRKAGDITITGQAADGVSAVMVRFTPQTEETTAVEKQVAVDGGRFKVVLAEKDIAPGHPYFVTASPVDQPEQVSPKRRLFVFPRLTGKQNPPVTRQGMDLICEGRRFGFVGTNYTRFDLGLGNKADYEVLAHDVLQMKSWGVRVVRMPSNVGLLQPEPGVFPDHPRYAELMRQHNLEPRWMDQIDYFVQLAGEHGIYVVIDWHSLPTDPYRYFVGGKPADKDTGKPGKAIAYLAPTDTKAVELDLSNPLHLKTLLDAHRWTARHFRGNPNILGFEIPHNEPHSKWMAIEQNWRRIVDQSAKAVHEGDPDRLTFVMGPSYSHNNLLPSDTWLLPDRASGAGPHFYQANGPAPLRPDAKKFKSPWLARDNEATFGWAFAAATMPLSAADYPFYNGESGKYGHEIALPDREDGARVLVEAQMVQEFAAGMSGRMEWTMWGNKGDWEPYKAMYQQQFRRFAPVFESGPLDRSKAEVAFVQSVAARKSENGYNFACVPFAKAALDVHLSPVHYITDDHFLYMASAEISIGLEQVVEAAEALQYKAYVVDRRHIDPRTEALLKAMGDKVLWCDSAEDLTAQKLAEFLKTTGVVYDTKTPREIQLAEGPEYLVVYRRLAAESNAATIYPHLRRGGNVELTNEAGQVVFKGAVADLANKGISIDLPLWSSAILKIRSIP